MKRAAVDIGTNSVRLLLAEYKDGNVVNREKKLIMTRLGKGQDGERRLGEKAIHETLQALDTYKQEWTQKGYILAGVIATSAVRDSVNPEDLIVPAREHHQIAIEIISGEKEAELGFVGAVKGFSFTTDSSQLIIDIGGGSTELIVGANSKVISSTSIDMGAVRMTERFYQENPPHDLDIDALRHAVKALLIKQGQLSVDPQLWTGIGIGGTITTLAAMDQSLETYDSDKVHGYCLSKFKVSALIERLMKLTLEEKRQLKGLEPKRADIILSGAIILEEVLSFFKMDNLIVSDFDNLEGVILQSMTP